MLNKKYLFLICAVIDGLVIDQFSKIWVDSQPYPPQVYIPLIGDFFRIQLEHNTGVAFSLQLPYPLLIAVNILFFGVLIYFLLKNLDLTKIPVQFLLGFLIAGALGNLIDRLRLGYVIDFIAIGNFPIFNFADSFITVTIFLLVLFYDKISRQIESYAGKQPKSKSR